MGEILWCYAEDGSEQGDFMALVAPRLGSYHGPKQNNVHNIMQRKSGRLCNKDAVKSTTNWVA